MDYLVFDIEISKTPKQIMAELGLKDEREIFNYPHRCGFAVGVAYNSLTKEYLIFKSARDMAKYLLNFNGLLISFNGRRFDIPCLLADIDIDTFQALQQKPHLDLLAHFYNKMDGKFRVSLNNISENTIKKVKTGNGANAPNLFQQGKWDELVDYCKNDVMLTKEVLEFGSANGYIFYQDNQTGRVEEMSCDYADWLIDQEDF
jgi:DEAD/DEAH box helicase domain-containing protein